MFKEINLPSNYFWDFQLESSIEEVDKLYAKAWERYLLEEEDIPIDDNGDNKNSKQVERPNYEFYFWGIRLNADLIAAASLISLPLDDSLDEFPDAGWQFVCDRALVKDKKHNTVSLLSAAICPSQRGKGISKLLVEQIKLNLKELGYSMLIAPIRPSFKFKYPEMSMEEYLSLKNNNGEIFDPWLRTHLKLGGEMLNICKESYQIKASLKKWSEWTKCDIRKNQGTFLPRQALVPVEIVGEIGIYTEPNVWVRHRPI